MKNFLIYYQEMLRAWSQHLQTLFTWKSFNSQILNNNYKDYSWDNKEVF